MRQMTRQPRLRQLSECTDTAAIRRRSHRSAFSLVELIAALILLGVVFSVSISMLATAARQRRGAEQRQFAIQHATNLLERTMTHSWSELPVGTQTLAPPPADIQAILPGLKCEIDVKDLPQAVASKLITVTVRWKDFSGHELAPVHLSAWMYPMEAASP